MSENKKPNEIDDTEVDPVENNKPRTSLKRFLIGATLAPLPVTAFWQCGIVGTVSGTVAGLGLFALSLTFGRRHVQYTICVVCCALIGTVFAALATAPMPIFPYTLAGGILGVLLGMASSIILKPWAHDQ